MPLNDNSRVLFITALTPELIVGGGGTAARSLLDLLRRIPNIDRVDVLALRNKKPRLPHRLRQLRALLLSAWSALPSKSHFDLTRDFGVRLARQLEGAAYDIIIINGGELFFIAGDLPKGVVKIGVEHNIELELYHAQSAKVRALPLIGGFFERDAEKLKRTEISGIESLHNLICLSNDDAQAAKALVPGCRVLALPTSFSYAPYRRAVDREPSSPLRLGFLGKYSWWPNVEAVQWFLERVLAGIPQGTIELHLFGPGAERFQDSHRDVRIRGFVPELATVWEESDFMICPMVSGSGINIKFLEAIYNRCPVLATRLAARGLPPIEDPGVVFLDDPSAWCDFLQSEQAQRLARTPPGNDLAAMYSEEHSQRTLQEFLAAIGSGSSVE